MVRNDDPSRSRERFRTYFARIFDLSIVTRNFKILKELHLLQIQDSLQILNGQLTNPLSFISFDQQIPQRDLMSVLQAGFDYNHFIHNRKDYGKDWRTIHHRVLYKKNDFDCDEFDICKEMQDIREKNMLFHSLIKGVEFRANRLDRLISIVEKLRLNYLRNRNELVNPYTSFAHEMRGEILVQLEKYNRFDEDSQEFTTRGNGWRVFGWSIKRDKELEKIERIVASHDFFNVKDLSAQPQMKQEVRLQAGLSSEVLGHFDQFFMTCVSPLQRKTQTLYGRSMELLYQYLSMRFGRSFRWSMLNEEVLTHFLSVWYLDTNRPSPVASKVFLNTLKRLFQWLYEENISDVYKDFKRVYVALIRTLPITIEARKWLKQNGVHPKVQKQRSGNEIELYQLRTSSSGPVIFINKKWKPIKLNGFPPIWAENTFWVRGSVVEEKGQLVFCKIENVYPYVPWSENQLVMSRP